MFKSLRSRLLLSFSVLIAMLMCLFLFGSLFSLLRNPLIYTNASQELRTAQRTLQAQSEQFVFTSSSTDSSKIEHIAAQLNVRLILVSREGLTLADSQGQLTSRLIAQPARLQLMAQRDEIAYVRDQTNRFWMVLVEPLGSQAYLILAVSRPRLLIGELLKNELIRPVIWSGLIGLALAVSLAFGLAQWIDAPLKRMSQAAEQVTSGHYQAISLEGPQEVRSLAQAFNRMSQRVKDTLQSQRDWVANVSHELKTPLTSIQGFAQAIVEGVLSTPEEVRQAGEVILGETNRMNRLVQDLVTLARLDAEPVEKNRTSVDINLLIQSVIEKFQPQAALAGVQLLKYLAQTPPLMGNEDQLVQVISNLIDNAIKFSPTGSTVEIHSLQEGNQVEIRVADLGSGIPPSDRERIFQRFYRADKSKPGAGLGLAITRQIVLAHGGTIRVEGNSLQGSVFIVDLPT